MSLQDASMMAPIHVANRLLSLVVLAVTRSPQVSVCKKDMSMFQMEIYLVHFQQAVHLYKTAKKGKTNRQKTF